VKQALRIGSQAFLCNALIVPEIVRTCIATGLFPTFAIDDKAA